MGEAQRRYRAKVTDTPMDGKRWTDAEYGLVLDETLTPGDAATLLGRSMGAVISARSRLRHGWSPREYEPPLSVDEVDVIRRTPQATAERLAEMLDRPYHMITLTRRALIRDEGATFGRGPYDKIPTMVGSRLLIARTCTRCGVIRGGRDFNKGGKRGKLMGKCRYCRIELRDKAESPKHRAALTQRVIELSESLGIPYMSKRYDEYTEKDIEVLRDDRLTTCEKAARLGRSYDAVLGARQRYSVSESRGERPEPGGVWTIRHSA